MIISFESSPDHQGQEENLTPCKLASLIKKRQNNGEDVKLLLDQQQIAIDDEHILLLDQQQIAIDDDELKSQASDLPTCRAQLNKRKTTKKNYLQANRQALQDKQQCNRDLQLEHTRQTKEKLARLEQKKQKLYGNVKSKVESTRIGEPPPLADSCSASSDSASFQIAFGRKVPMHAQAESVDASSYSSSTTKHNAYGKVPKYIIERKANIERMEEERRRIQETAPPEPGLILLEESERLKMLATLEENEKKLQYDLVNIPFTMDPSRAGRIRESISFRLKEIDDAKAIFSKEKVFVAQEERDC